MPTLGADVAIIREDGKIVLTKREDFAVWCLPGGGVDEGESAAQAAIREAREETGLEVELLRLVGIYSKPDWIGRGDHDVVFAARPVGGELVLTDETLDVGFFDPDDLPDPLMWWHRQRVIDAVRGAAGVAWRQDVCWPFGGANRAEIYRLRDEGAITLDAFAEKLCGPIPSEAQTLEAGDD